MRRGISTAVVLAAVTLVLAGCGNGEGEGAAADPTVAAAQAWADTITCPSDVAALDAAPTRSSTPRPGTDTSITPPGDVVAVVRCDTVRALPVDVSSPAAPTVGRTVLLDAQPVSWFADGDHWPGRSYSPAFTPDSSVVTLHYATGPDVVVTERVSGSGSTLATHDNGVLTCTVLTGAAGDPTGPPVTTCKENAGGTGFSPPIRPVAAGAPPVDCPSDSALKEALASPSPAATPREGTDEVVAPDAGVVVSVLCSNDDGARIEWWGEQATPKPQPTVTNPARCLAIGPPCTGLVNTWFRGYASGPPVLTVSAQDGTLAGIGPWLAEAPGLGGGVTNGVIACRYSDADVRPPAVAGCLPLAQATAGALPSPSPSGAPAP